MTDPLQRLTMVRETSVAFPAFPLPTGFCFRWYRPGDEAVWLEIQRAADRLQEIPADQFRRTFGGASEALVHRQLFLLDAVGHAIGTATAWFGDDRRGRDWGRLHWVAIRPEWQGRGLARPLLALVCRRLAELHPQHSYLTTAAQRLIAIRLYLEFGFVPETTSPTEDAVWREVLRRVALIPESEH